MNQGFCGTLVGGDLPNSSDVMCWESARCSCQIKGLNTSINKLCNGWSVWAFDLIWTSVIDICFCLWSSSNTVNLMWTGYWGILRNYCANFIYIHISCEHCRQPNEYQDVILQTEKEQNLPNISAYLGSRMCEYKHYNKNSLEHMFFPVTSIQPTCSLRPACTHTLRKTTETKGGACWQADQGQQGLFDQWRGPSGHWALTAYATAPTYRETNPHFISHICSIAQNKVTPEQETN